jgi:hypothetical protein
MDPHSALSAVVEAWIDHIIDAGGHTIIMADETEVPTAELLATPRKPKRQRQDLDATPRPGLSCTLRCSRAYLAPRLTSRLQH